MKDLNSHQTMPAAVTETAVRKPIQRWSAGRKRDIVLRLLRGESIEAVSRQVAVEPYRLEHSRERALAALDAGLKDRAEETRSRPGWAPPTSAWANSAWRTNCCARRLPPWRAARPFTGRGRADERGDLACHLPKLRRATRLPHLGSPALIILPCQPLRRSGTARLPPWPGATGRGRQSAGRDPC
jgi:hypothetical protein